MTISNSNFLFMHWPEAKFWVFGFYFRSKIVFALSIDKHEFRFATQELSI